jgi:hypothetical protein
MSDTGSTFRDALESMKAHLDTKRVDWGLYSVDAYPSYLLGKKGPALALEIINTKPILAEVCYPSLTLDYQITIKITYWSEKFRADAHYLDVLTMFDDIILFLCQHSCPDGFGELLATGNDFGPSVGEIQTGSSKPAFGGSIEVTLLVTKTITQS